MGIENFKANENFITKTIPFVVGGIIAFETCSFLGFTPFHLVDKEKKVDVMTEITNNNYSNSMVVENADGINNTLEYYSKWEEYENGGYFRTVSMYLGFNDDIILNKVVGQDKFDAKEYLGEPDLVVKEKKDFLTDDEILNNEEFIKVVLFSKDAQTVTYQESISNELLEDFGTILIFTVGLGVPYVYRKNKNEKNRKLSRK